MVGIYSNTCQSNSLTLYWYGRLLKIEAHLKELTHDDCLTAWLFNWVLNSSPLRKNYDGKGRIKCVCTYLHINVCRPFEVNLVSYNTLCLSFYETTKGCNTTVVILQLRIQFHKTEIQSTIRFINMISRQFDFTSTVQTLILTEASRFYFTNY